MPTLADLLISNPHGYGAFPPAPIYQGEIRNPDDPYAGTGGPSIPARLAYLLSGIPMAVEGAQSAREGSLAGDPIKAAGGIGQAALAAVPAMGRAAEPLVATMPRLAALLTGGTLAPMAAQGAFGSSPAEAGEVDPLQSLYADRKRLSDALAQAAAARDLEARTGKGPKYLAADSEVQRLTSQLGGLDEMIRRNEEKNSPEHALKIKQMEKEQADANAAAELNKPFQERHPNVALGVTLGAPIASAVLARYGLNKISDKGESLLADLLRARGSGDVMNIQDAAARLARWKGTVLPKQAAAVTVPATLPVDARALGDTIDKYSLPPTSPAQQAADERLSDPVQYAKDALPAIVSGVTGGFVGAKTARSAPRSDAAAMGEIYGGKDAPTLAKLLQDGADASSSVQGPIGRFQTARRTREQSNQQLENGSALVRGDAPALPASPASDVPILSSPSDVAPVHHSALQPRDRGGRFKGPPKTPKNDN